jgi:tRNA nucleotidyltransferase/poly(A) polymerase
MKTINNFLRKINKEKEYRFLIDFIAKYEKAEVYFVGGLVRDLILMQFRKSNSKMKDIDIVIRNIDANEIENFLCKYGKVNLVGKTFGVFKFVPKEYETMEPIDIALPRAEESFGTGGYKDFKIQSEPTLPLEEDLSRRDFTINAIAIDYKRKKIIDPFHGIDDIKKRIIRAVGNASDRFNEDYTRMLRAIRFACQLNFRIERKTWEAIKSLMPRINNSKNINGIEERIVPKELIAKELALSLIYNPLKMVKLYDESGALKELMPELLDLKGIPQPEEFHSEGDVWQHTMLCLKILQSKRFKKKFYDWEVDAELVFSILYHDIGKPKTISIPPQGSTSRITFYEHANVGAMIAENAIKRLALSTAGVRPDNVKWLIQNHMLFINADYKEMKNSTIVKYFFDKQTGELSNIGKKLLMLNYCDSLATIPKYKKQSLKNFKGILKRINQLRDKTKQQISLPKPYLNGNEIMSILNVKPGPIIGVLIESLREEQLSGRVKNRQEAIEFIKRLYASIAYK